MIVRTFDTPTAAAEFSWRAGWKYAEHDGNPEHVRGDLMVDTDGAVRQLRSSEDIDGKFWYWSRP